MSNYCKELNFSKELYPKIDTSKYSTEGYTWATFHKILSPIELNNNQILENNIGKFEGFQSKGYIDPNEFDNQNYSMFDKSFENYLYKKNNTFKLDDDFDPFQM